LIVCNYFICFIQQLNLAKQHRWIDEEKQHFGKEGSSYDFTGFSVNRAKVDFDTKKQRKDELTRKVNARAMNDLAVAEEQVIYTYTINYLV
jgi:hypothetical protein